MHVPTMMKSVYGIERNSTLNRIFELEHISSTLEKEKVLSELNPTEYWFFENMLNPFKKFNVTSKRVDSNFKEVLATKFTEDVEIDVHDVHTLKSILFNLEKRHVTGNEAVNRVKTFYDSQKLPIKKLILCILDKDFGGGVGKRLINKVLKKTGDYPIIPTFELMLCENLNNKDGSISFDKLNYPCYGELKLNGVRVIYMKRNGEIKCYSRAGKEYVNFTQINKEVAELLKDEDNVFLDGEIHGETFDSVMEVARAKKPTDSKDFRFTIWDFEHIDIFNGEPSTLKLGDRIDNINNLFYHADPEKIECLGITPRVEINDEEEAFSFLKKNHDAGEEGVVFKDRNGSYRLKRHKDWYKAKMFHEDSFTIIGTLEHNKKFGQLGSLVCKMDDSDNEFRVGSGFTDEQRIKLWEDRDSLIDMEVDVRYKERSKNTLQFPTFIKLRTDRL